MSFWRDLFFFTLSHPYNLIVLPYLVFGFISILHGIYFYFRFQKGFDQEVLENPAFAGAGLFYCFSVLQSGYCIAAVFPGYLRFMPEVDAQKFLRMRGIVKNHLIFHCIALHIGTLLLDRQRSQSGSDYDGKTIEYLLDNLYSHRRQGLETEQLSDLPNKHVSRFVEGCKCGQSGAFDNCRNDRYLELLQELGLSK